MCYLQETQFRFKDTNKQSEQSKKLFHSNISQKRSRVALSISDEVEFT